MKNQNRSLKNSICLFCMVLLVYSCSHASKGGAPPGLAGKKISQKYIIEITQMKFNPAVLTVEKGDSVVFLNHDMVMHDITEESVKAWSSSPINTNQSWLFIASESINYFCSIHPVMKGRVIVK